MLASPVGWPWGPSELTGHLPPTCAQHPQDWCAQPGDGSQWLSFADRQSSSTALPAPSPLPLTELLLLMTFHQAPYYAFIIFLEIYLATPGLSCGMELLLIVAALINSWI